MGKNTLAEIITSRPNADMDRNGIVGIASTKITENIIKILLQKGFIENTRKHHKDIFLALTYNIEEIL
jgi:ribosomal protein S8